jgi:predicted alpha/beta hydrolase
MSQALSKSAFEIVTDDGWTLRGDAIEPASAPRAVLVLAHAMFVTRKTLDRPAGGGFASTLAGHGFAVMNADLRGHGQSGPRADQGASYTYDAFVEHDIPSLVRAARQRVPNVPVVVVGHSLGGHAAAIAAGLAPESAPDALVAVATNLWAPQFDKSSVRRLTKRLVFAGWRALAEKKGYFDPIPLKVGTNPEPLAYVRHFVRMYEEDRLASDDGKVDYQAALAKVTIPIFSVSSDGDRLLGQPDCVAAFFKTCVRAEVSHRRVVDFDHHGRAPNHMTLVTDVASKPLWHEIGAWIESRVARRAQR